MIGRVSRAAAGSRNRAGGPDHFRYFTRNRDEAISQVTLLDQTDLVAATSTAMPSRSLQRVSRQIRRDSLKLMHFAIVTEMDYIDVLAASDKVECLW
jgi:hypothetical protein